MTIPVSQLLADISPELLVEFSGRAAGAEHVPVAQWLGRAFVAELARRRGEPAKPLEPLMLDEEAAEFGCEWLDATTEHFFCAAASRNDPDLLRLAAILDKLLHILRSTAAVPIQ